MEQITRGEFDRIKALKPFIHYTQEEKEFLIKMTQKFVDPNVKDDCKTCGVGKSDAKQMLYSWFGNNKDRLNKELEEMEKAEEEIKNAKEQAKKYVDGKEIE